MPLTHNDVLRDINRTLNQQCNGLTRQRDALKLEVDFANRRIEQLRAALEEYENFFAENPVDGLSIDVQRIAVDALTNDDLLKKGE